MAKQQAVVLVSRSFDDAANLMWNYYSANKLILRADIKESRQYIVAPEIFISRQPQPP